MLNQAFDFSGCSQVNCGRAEKQREDLLDLDASLKQTKATKEGQFGRRQMLFIGIQQAGQSQRLTVLLG